MSTQPKTLLFNCQGPTKPQPSEPQRYQRKPYSSTAKVQPSLIHRSLNIIIPPNTPIQPRLPIILNNQVQSSLVSPKPPPPIRPSYDRSFSHLAAKWAPTPLASLIGRPIHFKGLRLGHCFPPPRVIFSRIDYNRSPIVFHPRENRREQLGHRFPPPRARRPFWNGPIHLNQGEYPPPPPALISLTRPLGSQPRKKFADRFGTARSDLNRARRPFWNGPIHLNRARRPFWNGPIHLNRARRPFWNGPIHLNRASKKARRPFWNRPIRFKPSPKKRLPTVLEQAYPI
ncbi:hypothetical protein PGTUg99_026395 [Puccinia graminis f. sp. tritici]|uniref:Uncharacterized protein n=1 Tax=Puccinia graminis f. sp. tritici TaxID=56615 RepID=A0A5B0SCP1_PUCGR|nr:hypothetical protein PGTUg99_026395 [Puccinia graminis f. sp. tritici]